MKFLLVLILAFGLDPSAHRKALYNSLDPKSVRAALAFYELHPDSEEGNRALERVHLLLQTEIPLHRLTDLSSNGIAALIALVNRDASCRLEKLAHHDLSTIDKLGVTLCNRGLKGHSANTEQDVLRLSPDQVDVSRALMLAQFGKMNDEAKLYEALLDLMALQVLARVSLGSPADEKIEALNHFVFEEMRFRFPPHSIYAKEIDLYTFLPSVLDNHLGVCLGVTMVYLSLAQRIGLPLEIITPPGHIYVRHNQNGKITNIETTARGVNVPTDKYLAVNTYALQQRDYKESIGLTFVNQASVFLHSKRYQEAATAYEKAKVYLPDDPLVNELLGYAYLFTEREEEGKRLLRLANEAEVYGQVAKEIRSADYLSGDVDVEGLKAIFLEVDENRASILEKQVKLKQTLKKYPNFRAALVQLGVSYLQLNRTKEALDAFVQYHLQDPTSPIVEYYLAVLYGQRHNFVASWEHLHLAETLTGKKNFCPKALKELRRELILHCPEVY